MRAIGRLGAMLSATLVAGLLVAPAGACDLLSPCDPAPKPARDGAWLRAEIDRYRGGFGAGPLTRDPELDALAKRHAERMAAEARVFHNADGLRARRAKTGETLGENVGAGADLESIHDAFVASPSHRATMLGPFRRLGLGMAKRGTEIFVVEVFAAKRGPGASARRAFAPAPVKAPKPRRAPIKAAVAPAASPVEVGVTPPLTTAPVAASGAGGAPTLAWILAGLALSPVAVFARRRSTGA